MRDLQAALLVRRVKRWWPTALTGLAMVVGVWLLVALLPPGNPHRKQEKQLRETILQSMKCPTTATIGPVSFRSEQQGRFLVASGWVDGQNSFGAMIRQNYEAWFAEVTAGETKRLISFEWEKP